MTVITALDGERELDAKRTKQVWRPRSERDDHVARINRTRGRIDPPAAIHPTQRSSVAGKAQPTERGKARCIGARHRKRIADADRPGPVHRVLEHWCERGLERTRAVAIEHHIGDAEILGELELSALRGKAIVTAIKLEPTSAAEITLRVGLGAKHLMLGHCPRHEWAHQPGRFDKPRRL